MTAITGSVPPSPRGKALVREENLQTKIIRLGFDSPSRLFFYYIVFRILHVLTRVCVYPHAQPSEARIGSSVTLAECQKNKRRTSCKAFSRGEGGTLPEKVGYLCIIR